MAVKETSCLIVLLFTLVEGPPTNKVNGNGNDKECLDLPVYNKTYPFTPPIRAKGLVTWKIAIISDRDRASKTNKSVDSWESRFKMGTLTLKGNKGSKVATVKWDAEETDNLIKYDLSQKGRGMELSELVVYNGKLYTCDDRTGMVYELKDGGKSVLPFVHLNDGDGQKSKGYKCEWMTVKGRKLWIGSTGKEWSTRTGEFMNHDPEWIKVVDRMGLVQNINWTDNYLALRTQSGHSPPGYFFHESAVWSDFHMLWFFLPRKVSNEIYDDKKDEQRCGNLLLMTDNKFSKVDTVKIGRLNVSRGFSSFKFLPQSKDRIFVALKTVEIGDIVESYIGVYSIAGRVFLDETFISNEKFEGIEFI